ncbi:glutaredoxin 2 [Neorhizobium sp. JUb45]|uniref:glutaredoxin 2 n=1 Tax=Neorhizobium sp. JUb45 TaxID=2485113 RepID=UPI0010510A3B|nr:glutaredoxin 2 [Neorhizobium sp. JUb45]TCQ99433.1 glutaredoxin 2 [Neorhizobium sp. JUb45]
MKLYIYEHCPFCVKSRAIFGLKKRSFEALFMLNDDVATPKRLVGKKVAPIFERDGRHMAESMDIVAEVDALDGPVLTGVTNPLLADWINHSTSTVYALAIPQWAEADFPEFATTDARAYFKTNKEKAIGPFKDRLAESGRLIAAMNASLEDLAPMVKAADAVNGDLSTDDIHLFAHLRSLSIVRGLAYPKAVEEYRMRMSVNMGIDLHDRIAS